MPHLRRNRLKEDSRVEGWEEARFFECVFGHEDAHGVRGAGLWVFIDLDEAVYGALRGEVGADVEFL